MSENLSIKVPIEARSIFRVLAIRKVVEDQCLVTELDNRLTDVIKAIPRASRFKRKDFLGYTTEHAGTKEPVNIKNANEEKLCRSDSAFFGKAGDLGTVFDYQIPLAKSREEGDGVIDMLSFHRKKNRIYVIEAKRWASTEHPLRAMFEAITFWRMITDRDKGQEFSSAGESFITAYKESCTAMSQRGLKIAMPQNIDVDKMPINANLVPAILVSLNEKQGSTYDKLTNARGCYMKLYKKLHTLTGLRCFCYDVKMEITDKTKDLQFSS